MEPTLEAIIAEYQQSLADVNHRFIVTSAALKSAQTRIIELESEKENHDGVQS